MFSLCFCICRFNFQLKPWQQIIANKGACDFTVPIFLLFFLDSNGCGAVSNSRRVLFFLSARITFSLQTAFFAKGYYAYFVIRKKCFPRL